MKRTDKFPYPRRRLIRSLLRRLTHVAFAVLTDLQIIGQENLPERGPLLVVANHFSYIDPVAMVRVTPWPLEFVGGFQMPNAPASVTWKRCWPRVACWGSFPKLEAGRQCCARRVPARPFWPPGRVHGFCLWGLRACSMSSRASARGGAPWSQCGSASLLVPSARRAGEERAASSWKPSATRSCGALRN
jgi:hypothetical protein